MPLSSDLGFGEYLIKPQAVALRKGISIAAESTARFCARPGAAFCTISDMEDCVIALGYRGQASSLGREFIDVAKSMAARSGAKG